MSNTFCPLPWKHLATHPHGSVTLCCVADHSDSISDAYNNIDDDRDFKTLNNTNYDFSLIQNSDSFRKVRKEMLSGVEPIQCKGCYALEKVGIKSKRQYETERIEYTEEQATNDTDADGYIVPAYEFVELRLGNHCNLACRTCNMYSSSRWYSVWEEKYGIKPRIDKTMFDWPLDDDFWQSLLTHRKSLRLLYINGGEPLLIDKHKKFLEDLVQSGDSTNIEICYSTNSTVINNEYENIWKKFKTVKFMISIDDIGDRNAYIRWPADWNKVLKTFDWIRNLCDENSNMSYNILQTVSILNVFYLKQFEDFFSDKCQEISINFVTDPVYYDPGILPTELKKLILLRLEGTNCYTKIEKYFDIPKDKKLLPKFIRETQIMDKIRKENFANTFPEFYNELIKYV